MGSIPHIHGAVHPVKSAIRKLRYIVKSRRYRVEGDSMLPNLADRQYVLIEPGGKPPSGGDGPANSPLARGDIVVFRRPGPPHDLYVKRIVGMPGEEVRMAAGRVYLDGRLLEEGYATIPPEPGRRDSGEWWTGPEEYLLLGDNRRDSGDSRIFGPVSLSLVVGRVWFRYWPPGVWGRLSGEAGRIIPEG